jgi:hypothetical protein
MILWDPITDFRKQGARRHLRQPLVATNWIYATTLTVKISGTHIQHKKKRI